ncbi:MAG TPA: hypothetical protein VF627_08765 [Abditibacterium sp.]|jgi:hypothetical protein
MGGAAVSFFLFFYVVLPLLILGLTMGLIMALWGLIAAKPKGLRPPWWDWGMDDFVAEETKPVSKVEGPEPNALMTVETPPVVEPKIMPEAARPRW